MDKSSLPPLPTVEELFAPRTSQSSSLPFVNLNVNLFLPVPPLPSPSLADLPPMPPETMSQEHADPCSPLPPQPTSPLVDRFFDYKLADNKSSDSLFQLEQNKATQEVLSGPPHKKARYGETAVSATSLQYDSREEGEISDDADDADQSAMSDKSGALNHKHFTVSRSEHVPSSSSHQRVPTGSPQSITRASSSSNHHHQSHTADVVGRSSHHRHRVHRAHPGLNDPSKSEGVHRQKVDRASAYRTERSSSRHKQPETQSDGHKVSNCNKASSASSSHRRISRERAADTESAKHELQPSSRNDGHKGSGSSHKHQSNGGAVVAETAKPESRSLHHHRRSHSSLSKRSSKDGSQMSESDCQPSLSDKSETAKKDSSETDIQLQPSSSADHFHRRGLSGGISRSTRFQHIPPGSTLGSEIVKNMSRSSAGQKAVAGTSLATHALQSVSLQHQLTDNTAADQNASQLNHQQQPLNSNKASRSGTDSHGKHRASGHQSHAVRQIKTPQPLCQQQNAVVETAEKLSCQPQILERPGDAAGNCQRPADRSVNAEHLSEYRSDGLPSLHADASHIPQPAASTTPAVTQHYSTTSQTLCPYKDLDAPYSPGSLDLDDFFEPIGAYDLQEAVSHDTKTSSDIDAVNLPRPDVKSSTKPTSELTSVNIEDSVMEIDTVDLVAAEEVAESAAVEGRGQEYEIIDDLDSNADEVDDDDPIASSENSEAEFDSGEEETLPRKHVRTQRGQRVRETDEALEEMQNDLEIVGEDGDDDFQAPLVNNKIVLRGESEN